MRDNIVVSFASVEKLAQTYVATSVSAALGPAGDLSVMCGIQMHALPEQVCGAGDYG